MLNIVLAIAGVLLVAIVAALIYAATRPDTFRLQRSTSIKASPEKIFPLINDYRNWALWSPYENKDPAMKRTYSGAPAGKGAIYEWDGNKNVGKGRMEIVDASPPNKIVIKLDFLKPFRRPQRRRVHAGTAGRHHQRDMGDAWPGALHRQDHPHGPGHGQDDRWRFRDRSRQPEGCGREVDRSRLYVSSMKDEFADP